MKSKQIIACILLIGLYFSCSTRLAPVRLDALTPLVLTQQALHDTSDPAIWINPVDAAKSLVIGTDTDTNGGLYLYDLKGKIIKKSIPLLQPGTVDIAYGLIINGTKTDIAVTTERLSNKMRIFSLPDLEPIDNGGIAVFTDEAERGPVGISLYTRPSDKAIFAIVGRKTGPSGTCLWQYELLGSTGKVTANLVRKFGKFSGKKEIEAIAVDNELGYIYYSDEQSGIRKYMADPSLKNDTEIAFFGTTGFEADNEGIAIYKKDAKTGYLLVSNQQANTFMVYPREGANGNANEYPLLAEVPTSAIECDGADVTGINLGGTFKNGMFVAMSNGMTFHYYAWNDIQARIDTYTKK